MSKQVVCLVLALCAVAAAMTMRNRRAMPESEESQQHIIDPALVTGTREVKKICAPTTPCAWVVYKPFVREIEYNFTNDYCECAAGTKCQYYDDNISISAYEHRCRNDTDNHRLLYNTK